MNHSITDRQKLHYSTWWFLCVNSWGTIQLFKSSLVTTAAFNIVENKIPKVSDYDSKISDFEAKYYATSNTNKFTSKILDAEIK